MDEIKSLQSGDTKLDHSVERYNVKKQFLLICLALVLLSCGYTAMLLLQSSINIVDGVGTNATAVSYALSVVFGLFFAPFAARLAGAKWTLLGSELCYLFYVVANFYPRKWLIMIAAASVGIGEGLFWVVVGILFVHFGQLYHKHTLNRTKDSCVREFSGILFSTFQTNTIIGNALVFVILHFWKDPKTTQNDLLYNLTSITTISPMVQPTAAHQTENDRLFYCGTNDCQNANLTQQNLEKYRPTNLVALYALISAFAVIMLAGIILQACVTPSIPGDIFLEKPNMENSASNMNNDENGTDCDIEVTRANNEKSMAVIWWNTVKGIFWRSLSLKQILLYPITIYVGLVTGFLYCEVTRAYASCINGVSQVGVCSIIYASANCASAYASGKLASKFTLQSVIACATVLDSLLYLLCLLWIPTENSSWIVYILFIMFGIGIGMWNIIVSNMYSETFTQNKDLSFTMWSALSSIGFATQYGWSTLICVRGKIYIQIILLPISMICLQILRYKSNK